eukprot:scaffold8400_cov213-Skeletonema_marinoi.AAC.1
MEGYDCLRQWRCDDGTFRNSEPHEVGKMTCKDGRVCEGIWQKEMVKYEGELADGKPHGRGK